MEKERKLTKKATIKLMQKIIKSLQKDKSIKIQIDNKKFTIKPKSFELEFEQSSSDKELEITLKQ